MGQDAAVDVDGLFGGDTHKEVCVWHTGVLQRLDTGGRRLQCHHIVFGHDGQAILILVNEYAVLFLA